MSILMDALKQQQAISSAPAASRSAVFWLGVLAGASLLAVALAAGYWLGSQQKPVIEAKAEQTASTQPELASQQQILAALTTELKPAEPAQQPVQQQATAVESTDPVRAMPETERVQVAAEPATRPAQPTMPSLDELEETEVSAELQQRFAQAMDELEQEGAGRSQVRVHDAPARDITELAPQVQRQLPPMRFEAHVFANMPSRRWVKVNGRTLQQGQWLTTDIQLVEIHQNHVVLRYRQQEFSMAALSEWPG